MANFNDPTMDDDIVDAGGTVLGNKGNTLAYVPEKRFILTMDKDFTLAGKPAYFSLDSSYTGRRWADETNTTPMQSYSMMNVRALTFIIEYDCIGVVLVSSAHLLPVYEESKLK